MLISGYFLYLSLILKFFLYSPPFCSLVYSFPQFTSYVAVCTVGHLWSKLFAFTSRHDFPWTGWALAPGLPAEPSSNMVKGVCEMHPQLLTTQMQITSLKHKAESQKHISSCYW